MGKKIGGELAARCQAILDERIIAMRRGVSNLGGACYLSNNWWQTPGVMGHVWYIGSGWQGRSQKLYAAAAEVAGAIGSQ